MRALWRDKVTLFALVSIALLLLCALVPQLIAPYDYAEQALARRNLPPLSPGAETGQLPHILGTDGLGRDLLSRLIHGARVSITVASLSVIVSGTFGIVVGLVSGYFRGWLDDVWMRLADLQMGFPGLLLALFVLFVIGPGFFNVVIVMAIIRWPIYARVTRGMTLSVRESAFVEGARTLGSSDLRIIVRDIFPNLLSPLVVLGTLEIARMILLEASMSFLGLGIQPPAPSWGLQLAQGRDHIRTAWWLVTMPGLAILITALSANLVSTWLREISDPAQRWRWLLAKTKRRNGQGADGTLEAVSAPRTEPAARRGDRSEPLLAVEGLVVEFETDGGIVRAVNGVDLALHHGESLAIIGESGSGKSVTAQAIMGLVDSPPGRIAGGRIIYEGQDIVALGSPALRRLRGDHIALVLQDALASLNPRLRVGFQLAEVLRLRAGKSRSEAKKGAVELLERVHVPMAHQRVDDYPHEFSGGMRQRVMIAMALALEPRIIIADEPTSALDVTVQAEIMDLFEEVRREGDRSLVLITHDLSVVAEQADSIAIMYAGRIVESGPVAEVFQRAAHPYTRGLMGSVPEPGRKLSRLESIPGSPPDLLAVPDGCAFHPRCPIARDVCRTDPPPPLYEVTDRHVSACHVYDEVLAAGPRPLDAERED